MTRSKGLHALHRRKIELADELVVIAPDGRIGETTAEEIAYGRSLGKPVRYWEPDGQRAPIDPVPALEERHRAQRLLSSDTPTPASSSGAHREDLGVEIMRQVVVLDAADLASESDFWAGMVGGPVLGDDQFHCVFDAQDRWVIGVQLVPDHIPPVGRTAFHSRSTSISTSTTPRWRTRWPLRSEPGCCKQPTI